MNALSSAKKLGSRVANIAWTAQVQLAYAYASDSRTRALTAAQTIESTWPDTPLRNLVVQTYRSQARSAERLAADILVAARGRCGLAFANLCGPRQGRKPYATTALPQGK